LKQSILEILACPVCKGQLTLDIKQEKDGEIISGSLYCSQCNHNYPIIDSIPNLLPPDYKE
jgi:uncharacterized protein YbaR (Trm112 family)